MISLVDKPGPISIIEDSFDPVKSVNYSLHVLADENGMEVALLDRVADKWVGIHAPEIGSFESSLEKSRFSFLETSFPASHFSWINNKITLVPAALYDPTKKRSYLELACGDISGLQVEAVPLNTCNAILIYGIPQAIISAAQKRFGNTLRIYHQSQVTIQTLLQSNKNKQGKRVYAIVHNTELEILVSDGHQLILYNVYTYQNIDEAVYYIMNTMEVLQLNPEFVPVVMGGRVYKNSSLFELIYKYVRHTELLTLPDSASYCYAITEVPPQRFYSLFAQVVCAS